ncbi:hypothetical protein KCU90_g4571, partial [Aureobasidium melanogenum]
MRGAARPDTDRIRHQHVALRCRASLVQHAVEQEFAAIRGIGSAHHQTVARHAVGQRERAVVIQISRDREGGVGPAGECGQRVADANHSHVQHGTVHLAVAAERGPLRHTDRTRARQLCIGMRRVADHQRARRHVRVARVRLHAIQDQGAGSALRHRAATTDNAAIHERVRAVENQCAVVHHVAGEAAARAAVADLQRAAVDGRTAGMGDRSATADRAAVTERVSAVENQRAVIHDVARQCAARAAVADLQCAGRDGRGAGEAVLPGEQQSPEAPLDQRAGAANGTAQRNGVRLGVDRADAIERHGPRTGERRRGLQCATIEDERAGRTA